MNSGSLNKIKNLNSFSTQNANNNNQDNNEDLRIEEEDKINSCYYNNFHKNKYFDNVIRFSEDYSRGFEILNIVLSSFPYVFSNNYRLRKQYYFSKLIKNIINLIIIKRSDSNPLSIKSIISDNSIRSYKCENSDLEFNKRDDKLTIFTNKKNNSMKNLENKEKFNISSPNNESVNKNMENLIIYDKLKNKDTITSIPNNKNKKFMYYPSNRLNENSSLEEDNSYTEKSYIKEYDSYNMIRYKKAFHMCSKENIYLAKIIVKNCCMFYKRNKKEFTYYFINNLKYYCRLSKISLILRKNILAKQLFIKYIYFSKFKRIVKFYEGFMKLFKFVYKYLTFIFYSLARQTRILYIIKKNLNRLTNTIDQIIIRNTKFIFMIRLYDIFRFKKILPFYDVFLSRTIKIFKRNCKKLTFTHLKKYYFALKIYTRNLQFLISTIDSIFWEIKKAFWYKFKLFNKKKQILFSLIMKEHSKRYICLKKGFLKFIENSLDINNIVYKLVKLKKVFYIYKHHMKLYTLKVNRLKNFLKYKLYCLKNNFSVYYYGKITLNIYQN